MAYGSTNIIARMKGATETKAGRSGIVPPPPAGAIMKFLRGDGVWGNDDTKIDKSDIVQNATTSATNKIVSAAVAKNLQDQITKQNTNMTYNAGESISLRYDGAGYVTDGTKTVHFTIPLTKEIGSNVKTIKGDITKLLLRQDSIHLVGDTTKYEATFHKTTSGIRCYINKSDGFPEAVNNAVVGVYIAGTITLS